MIAPFFALMSYCGIFSCSSRPAIDFENSAACVEFVQIIKRNNGLATCFDRATGKIVLDSLDRH